MMLILVLAVAPFQYKGRFNISDPEDVDFQNVVYESAPQSPDQPQNILVPRKHPFMSAGTWGRKANRQIRYNVPNAAPPKKNDRGRQEYAWYVENPLWFERESCSVAKEPGARTHNRHDCRLKVCAKSSPSPVIGRHLSIRVLGAHYRVVTGGKLL